MSRIGEQPVPVPSGVTVTIGAAEISVKGPKGELALPTNPYTEVSQEDGEILVTRPSNSRRHRSMHGLTRSLIANMVEGVTNGFEKRLQLVGQGSRAQMQGKTLQLTVGFSHVVNFETPEGTSISVEEPGSLPVGSGTVPFIPIVVSGIDKQFVGETAAAIRRIKKPEPYTPSKGIRYEGEAVRNLTKKQQTSGG